MTPSSESFTPERIIALYLADWDEQVAPNTEQAGRIGHTGNTEHVSETRDFARVFAQLTEIVPQIEELRPGLVLMRARGPARYYGGEAQAASALLAFAESAGLGPARVGIADGKFAAEQAATATEDAPHEGMPGVWIVPPGGSARFLSPLPIACVADDKAAALLSGLGIYTLGRFAELPESAVRARFGPAGVRAHRQARGLKADRADTVRPQQAAKDFEVALEFEPPVNGAEHLAFACRTLAERFVGALSEERLVCTALRITLTDDIGVRNEHEWAHPRMFTPEDVVARIRWQVGSIGQPSTGAHTENTGAGITSVRIAPVRIDRASAHEPSLWSTAPDERVHHHLSRAQGLLGHREVGTVALGGGRLLLERQNFIPWGTAPKPLHVPGPWPGALLGIAPSLVFTPPLRAKLLDSGNAPVDIDADDLLASQPVGLRVEGQQTPGLIRSWSTPWPIRERWWEHRAERFRLQVELENGDAWLLLGQRPAQPAADPPSSPPSQPAPASLTPLQWFAEGRYD